LSIIVATTDILLISQANLLANSLNLDFIEDLQKIPENSLIMILTPAGIGITDNIKNRPIYVDFSSNKTSYRRKSNQSEFIIKATGLNKLKFPIIVDATAGLGGDSFVIASKGHKIHMIERSPIVSVLLEDGLKRARLNPEINDIANNMIFRSGDAHKLLANINPDIIYLDPMFPSKTKNSAVKREMQLFKMIVGADIDASDLLKLSLEKATYRVVVKRPIKSPFLGDIKPSFQMLGNSSRFDIYHTNHQL
jgi:16S rRNA (guanine1516-N2)-methyltransferase